MPRLEGARSLGARAIGPKAVAAQWILAGGVRLTIACNLGDVPLPYRAPEGVVLWGTAAGDTLPPAVTAVWIDETVATP